MSLYTSSTLFRDIIYLVRCILSITAFASCIISSLKENSTTVMTFTHNGIYAFGSMHFAYNAKIVHANILYR